MSRATLNALLRDYCHVQKMIDEGDNWAVKTANNAKELGSKANLVEEIIREAKKLGGNNANVANNNKVRGGRKTRKARRY